MKSWLWWALPVLAAAGVAVSCAPLVVATPTRVRETVTPVAMVTVTAAVHETSAPTAFFVFNETKDPHLRTRAAETRGGGSGEEGASKTPLARRTETATATVTRTRASGLGTATVVAGTRTATRASGLGTATVVAGRRTATRASGLGTATVVAGTRTATRVRAGGVISGTVTAAPTAEYGKGLTNVERAQARLSDEGVHFALVAVSPLSEGLEGEIYRDLNKRRFRATTGADEGFDTTSVNCHPYCVFVRLETANEIGVESWVNVLRHEYRHMVQADHHPNLAAEFRQTPDGLFTTYAAFLEACADDGIFVAELAYHASERMPQVRTVPGVEGTDLLGRACAGFPEAYTSVVKAYELKVGEGTWQELFPPYK